MFPKNRESRTISLNAQYIVAFKNPRDATQVTHLARQMYPGRVKYMQETFKDATSGPYGYLLLDLKQETPEHLRLRTNVFPDEVQYTYLPKIKGDSHRTRRHLNMSTDAWGNKGTTIDDVVNDVSTNEFVLDSTFIAAVAFRNEATYPGCSLCRRRVQLRENGFT